MSTTSVALRPSSRLFVPDHGLDENRKQPAYERTSARRSSQVLPAPDLACNGVPARKADETVDLPASGARPGGLYALAARGGSAGLLGHLILTTQRP